MRSERGDSRSTLVGAARSLVVLGLFVVFAVLAASAGAQSVEAPVGLGTADSFAVLAGTTITNTGPTTITGDVGLHPGSAVTGFADVTLDGETHVADAVAEQAKVDLVTAYGDAAGRGPASTIATELGGETLLGGVYDSAAGTFGVTGTLTLDAQGDPDTVWVFQAASTLITASDSSVNLINGADACNVYWQVGSSATLGTGTDFVGTVMALESITLTTGATIQGRALARNGAVTMDTNTITNAACVTQAPPPTTAPPTTAPPTTAPPTTAPPPATTPPATTPPVTVQTPTRIDTGAGGAAPLGPLVWRSR